MNTMMRNRQSFLVLILSCFILPLIEGCATPVRMQDSVRIVTSAGSMHIGDIDGTGTDNRLGQEAFMAGDPAKAYKLWEPLAKQGDAAAQNNLGHLYLGDAQGVVPQDFAEALKWYSKAAEQWHANAHFSIGMLHLLGLGVPRDNAEAVKWIRKSAEQGYEYAQYFLGNMYVTGWDGVVPQDDTEAKKWMLKAATQGNLDARQYLRK
jgi:TPR repeat protein